MRGVDRSKHISPHIAPSRSTSNRKHFDFPCDQSIFRARSRSQTALAAPSPVFCPRARPCSLNHRRGYAFGREHAHGAKILGDHRGPWCNMRASQTTWRAVRFVGSRRRCGSTIRYTRDCRATWPAPSRPGWGCLITTVGIFAMIPRCLPLFSKPDRKRLAENASRYRRTIPPAM